MLIRSWMTSAICSLMTLSPTLCSIVSHQGLLQTTLSSTVIDSRSGRDDIKRCRIAPSHIQDSHLCLVALTGEFDLTFPTNVKGVKYITARPAKSQQILLITPCSTYSQQEPSLACWYNCPWRLLQYLVSPFYHLNEQLHAFLVETREP